jgi:hypothetical protein
MQSLFLLSGIHSVYTIVWSILKGLEISIMHSKFRRTRLYRLKGRTAIISLYYHLLVTLDGVWIDNLIY